MEKSRKIQYKCFKIKYFDTFSKYLSKKLYLTPNLMYKLAGCVKYLKDEN